MSNLPITAKILSNGHFQVGGCDVASLAGEFGTPLYVMDEKTIREKCREYTVSFRSRYPNVEVVYAAKALCTAAVLKITGSEGLGVDVAGGGELFTALKAGCSPKKIYFHGNNKSKNEIREGLKAGVGRFVVDNLFELKNLDEISGGMGIRADILIRINPGIEAHTHEFVRTGQVDSKFGIPKDKVLDAVMLIDKMKNVNFSGLHSHIGSQILDVAPFVANLDVLLELSKDIHNKTGIHAEEISIGGGLGIDYSGNTEVPSIKFFAETIASHLKNRCVKLNIAEPKLILEPGRSIIAASGVTLYSIGVIKDIPGIRKYVVVDGGMADNPRYMLYQSRYDALIANKADKERTCKMTVAGRFCESGDVILKDIMLQEAEVGDLLAVLCTGAYNYSMASNYNRVPRPAMVLVNDGAATLIIGRESYEDVASKDIV